MSIVNNPFVLSAKESFDFLYGEPLVIITLLLFLSIATYTDIKDMKIPNKLNGAFAVIRLLLIPLIGFGIADILGAIFAFITLMIPAMIKMHKMGGDIKCLTVVGLYVGIYLIPFFLVFTCIYFMIYVGISAILKKKVKNVPFAPFFLLTHLTLLGFHFILF